MQTIRRTIILLICCGLAAGARAQVAPNLKAVMERAQDYIAAYEEQLGTLIGEEEYNQTAIWDASRPGGLRVGSRRRRLISDFLLVRVGETWFGARNVQRVDLARIEGKRADFGGILRESPQSIVQHLKELSDSNTRYNIGDFIRTFNVPTFPLTILHRSNFARFTFEKGPERKIDNVMTWEVRFSEVVHPTLIRDLKGRDQTERGRFWIDPDSGRILKTENLIDAQTDGIRAKVRFVVTYKPSAKLNMLVPDTMQENYDSEYHHVEGFATYSNFRRFETEVKLDIGPAEQ
jgi:hypothetical protein